jgi:hypothetical protein
MSLFNKLKTLKTKLSRHSLITRDPYVLPEASSPEATPSEGILAFRTITTMLALIQEGTTFSDSKGRPSTEQRRELKLLNALSTVIARNVEISAVVVKPDDDLGNLRSLLALILPVLENNSPLPSPLRESVNISGDSWPRLIHAMIKS